jgi:Flp pilus assembly protein TadD
MTSGPTKQPNGLGWVSTRALALVAVAVSLGGCAGGIGDVSPGLLADASATDQSAAPANAEPNPAVSADPKLAAEAELQKATIYWGQKYSKSPTELEPALSYAKNLRAIGEKRQALQVLQASSVYHGADKGLAAEYGKLALELDQTAVAKRMLAVADDPTAPDWKVVSARGTAEAKLGNYKDAIPLFERALALNPGHPSLQNNLALAYTMNGDASKAEGLLRQASAAQGANAKVKQNLALVLGLQGKYDEATKVGSENIAADGAKSNTQLIRNIVRLDPKAMPQATPQMALQPKLPANTAAIVETAGWKPVIGPEVTDAQKSWVPQVAAATGPQPTPIQAKTSPAR